MNYYHQNGTEVAGRCKAVDSVVDCGRLNTTLNCESNYTMFNNLYGNPVLSWDSYDDLKLTFTVPYNVSNITTLCTYVGSKYTYNWQEGDWKVLNCTCGNACCYEIGSNLNMRKIDDFLNRPRANLTGSLSGGDFCNNTLSTQDLCYVTGSYNSQNFSTTSWTCQNMGCKSSPTFVEFRNYSAYLQWDTCSAQVALSGRYSNGAMRMGGLALMMIGFLALLQVFN